MLANFYADPEKLATPKDYILRVSAVSQKTLQNELSYVLANASSIVNGYHVSRVADIGAPPCPCVAPSQSL